jgi:large subunit ribosomal protein L23
MAIFKKDTPTKEVAKSVKAVVDGGTKALYADENKKAAEKKGSDTSISQAYRVLVKPLISEKASHMQVLNQYFFAVALDANRIEVARAIKAVYGIAPIKVNIIRSEGKTRRFGRTTGRRKDWKKAMVVLPKGKTISLYEGV